MTMISKVNSSHFLLCVLSLITLMASIPKVAAELDAFVTPLGGRELPDYDFRNEKGQCIYTEVRIGPDRKSYAGFLAFNDKQWGGSPCQPPFFEALANYCGLIPSLELRLKDLQLRPNLMQLKRIVLHEGYCLMWVASVKDIFQKPDSCVQRAINCFRPVGVEAGSHSCVCSLFCYQHTLHSRSCYRACPGLSLLRC